MKSTFRTRFFWFLASGVFGLCTLVLAGKGMPVALAQGGEYNVIDFYRPTGWVLFAVSSEEAHSTPAFGSDCLSTGGCYQITYNQPGPGEWFSIYWLHPLAGVGSWAQPGEPGCNLTGAT